jgi:hypothetical protein
VSLTDKNSPKTSNSSSSTSIVKTDNRVVNGGVGVTAVGGNTDLSNISTGFGGSVNVTTTDQGAIAAGLKVALAGIDSANQSAQSAIQSTNSTAQGITAQAIGVAESVAQGQQNTTIKYVMYIFLGIAAAVAIYAISKKKG